MVKSTNQEEEPAMIKVQDIIYVAHRVPDLDRMEAFLTDFGMVKAERRADKLFMRGAGSRPFIHMTAPTRRGRWCSV